MIAFAFSIQAEIAAGVKRGFRPLRVALIGTLLGCYEPDLQSSASWLSKAIVPAVSDRSETTALAPAA